LTSGSAECEIAYSHSGTRVRLAASARADLVAIAERMSGRDGAEAGGLLLGSVAKDLSLVEIVAGGGPGPKAIRERDRYQPDAEHDAAVAARACGESGGTSTEVGCWHTHAAVAAPSQPDTRYFAGMRDLVGDLYVGLIAVPVAGGDWHLEAFVVRSGFSRDICEWATLT